MTAPRIPQSRPSTPIAPGASEEQVAAPAASRSAVPEIHQIQFGSSEVAISQLANSQHLPPGFWRSTPSVLMAGGLRQLREVLQGNGGSPNASETLSAISNLLRRADFSDLIIQQEIHPLLPGLLDTLQNPRASSAEQAAVLEVLTVLQDRVGVDPDLEHLFWVPVLYALGRHVSGGSSLPMGFHHLDRESADAASEAVLRNYFSSASEPEPLRNLALLAWSRLSRPHLSGRDQEAAAATLLRLAEGPSGNHLFRRLAFHGYCQFRQGRSPNVLEENDVHRVAMTLLDEAAAPGSPWLETVETFRGMFRGREMGSRVTLHFMALLDRVLTRENPSPEEAQRVLTIYRECQAGLQQENSVAPAQLQASHRHLQVLRGFLENSRYSGIRLGILSEYSRNLNSFLREANYLGNPVFALPELRLGVRGMQGILTRGDNDVRILGIASRFLAGALESLPAAEQAAMEQWAANLDALPGTDSQRRALLHRVSIYAAARRGDSAAISRIEGDLVGLMRNASSPAWTGTFVAVYSDCLERGFPLSRQGEVIEQLAARILRPEESENRYDILQLFNGFLRHNAGSAPSIAQVFGISQNILQDTQAHDELRLSALATAVTALRRLQDPARHAVFGQLLRAMAREDPSPRVRQEAQWAIEHSLR